MRDRHEQQKIASQEKMKAMELAAKQGDAQQKAQLANQQAMQEREAHQAEMLKRQSDMQIAAQKAGMAQAAAQAKQGDLAARANERRAAAAMKPPPGGGFGA